MVVFSGESGMELRKYKSRSLYRSPLAGERKVRATKGIALPNGKILVRVW